MVSIYDMKKRGQFYLITTIIIITMIAGLVIVSNYSRERSNIRLDYLGEELGIESEKVLDYGIKNDKNIKDLLENFTKTYSVYSSAENLYFIFGNENEITLAGYKKLNSGSIFIDIGSGNEVLNLNKEEYNSRSFSSPTESIKVTVDDIEYAFTINPGENFYFILSKEINGEKYILKK